MKATKKKKKTARKPTGLPGGRIAAAVVQDDELPNCDECGQQLKAVRLDSYDFAAWAGFPVTLRDVPGLMCDSCGGETVPGYVVNATLAAVCFDAIQLPHRLPATLARRRHPEDPMSSTGQLKEFPPVGWGSNHGFSYYKRKGRWGRVNYIGAVFSIDAHPQRQQLEAGGRPT